MKRKKIINRIETIIRAVETETVTLERYMRDHNNAISPESYQKHKETVLRNKGGINQLKLLKEEIEEGF